jgi:hypothetical protein
MSNQALTIWQCPITGGKHSPLVLKALSKAKVAVDKNTALQIENMSSDQVAV